MTTIWKFPLARVDRQSVNVPRGARFLSAGVQAGQIVAWALVNPHAPDEVWTVLVIGTGNPIPPDSLTGMAYLTTVQDGPFVWHVFVPEGAA